MKQIRLVVQLSLCVFQTQYVFIYVKSYKDEVHINNNLVVYKSWIVSWNVERIFNLSLQPMDNWIPQAMKDAGSCEMQHHLQIFEICCFLERKWQPREILLAKYFSKCLMMQSENMFSFCSCILSSQRKCWLLISSIIFLLLLWWLKCCLFNLESV